MVYNFLFLNSWLPFVIVSLVLSPIIIASKLRNGNYKKARMQAEAEIDYETGYIPSKDVKGTWVD